MSSDIGDRPASGHWWHSGASPDDFRDGCGCSRRSPGAGRTPPLLAHLDQEEAEILPLASQYLSLAEWNLLGEHAVTHTPKRELLLGFGGILEDASPQERTMMMSVLPLPGKVMYRLYGRRAYIKQATAIRGTPPVGL